MVKLIVRFTTAPEAYDGFGTRTMAVVGRDRGQDVRQVAICPDMETLGVPTLGNLDEMHASFRLAMQQLNRYIREAQVSGLSRLGRVSKQLKKDLLVDASAVSAACDHCGKEQPINKGREFQKCVECGKKFSVEY